MNGFNQTRVTLDAHGVPSPWDRQRSNPGWGWLPFPLAHHYATFVRARPYCGSRWRARFWRMIGSRISPQMRQRHPVKDDTLGLVSRSTNLSSTIQLW